jgi:hypothetical protein
MKTINKVYHRIRRFLYPDLYWNKQDLDEIDAFAKRIKEAFNKIEKEE